MYPPEPQNGRSYLAIRREEGKPDAVKHFPDTATDVDAIDWCEADGYEVIGQEITETPNDPKYISFTVVKVRSKRREGWKNLFETLRSSSQSPDRAA
jgi:hypothetical protein